MGHGDGTTSRGQHSGCTARPLTWYSQCPTPGGRVPLPVPWGDCTTPNISGPRKQRHVGQNAWIMGTPPPPPPGRRPPPPPWGGRASPIVRQGPQPRRGVPVNPWVCYRHAFGANGGRVEPYGLQLARWQTHMSWDEELGLSTVGSADSAPPPPPPLAKRDRVQWMTVTVQVARVRRNHRCSRV